ncbi:unnamed protein product [Arabidopsis thaliana]|uniref:(thale cress) hypothetical protein n=1 Tax=Arabidopsis thaliana TaxID=3702 RepID=A0A7G2F1S1_ARATH|nr:unnamed protein product [Arabidopsis thaliana]
MTERSNELWPRLINRSGLRQRNYELGMLHESNLPFRS